MLIIGWTTNDYRGRKAWAALWSNENTPGRLEAANDFAARLSGYVFSKPDHMPLAVAKIEVIATLVGTDRAPRGWAFASA